MSVGRSADLSSAVQSLLDEMVGIAPCEAFADSHEDSDTPTLTGLLDPHAQQVISTAVRAAGDWSGSTLDGTHVLWALTQTRPTARMLAEGGVAVDRLARTLRTLACTHQAIDTDPRRSLSPSARQVLLGAYQQARHENADRLAPRHLLLGVATDADSAAGRALARAIELGGQARTTGHDDSATPRLDEYGTDLTARAADETDPLIGRSRQLDQALEVLARRTRNNPVLVGEPGVGKTAIAEGLARRFADGTVPATLAGRRVVALNATTLAAGSHHRGGLERRLRELVGEIDDHQDKLLVFFDEIHLLFAPDTGFDAAAILKPALAHTDLPLLGATTIDNYRKHIDTDPLLHRRFHPITVPEPSVSETVDILGGLRGRYQRHHRVRIDDGALRAAANLTDRHVTDRCLPDKAVDVLDHACARVRLHHDRTPGTVAPADVVADAIADIVAERTGIPLSEVTAAERDELRDLEHNLAGQVIGQGRAVDVVAAAIRRARAGLSDPDRPLAGFLFTGPTGVGKTELARALARTLFGDTDRMVRFDMGEFQEKHTVSRLIGAPPGYLGHDEPGQLTDRIRTNPYSVLLLDEIEKAHPDIANTLLQVLDAGRLTDATGRTIDFTNTVIIMTSNLGADRSDTTETTALLTEHFSPEFINRIDEIVPFLPLGTAELADIATLLLDRTHQRLHNHGVSLLVTDQARTWLARQGHHPEFGARPLRRVIERELHNRLAALLLDGSLPSGCRVVVDIDGDSPSLRIDDGDDDGAAGRHAARQRITR